MSDAQLAKCLAELGNITRLKIFKLLVKAGDEGVPVGFIQEKLNIPASTLSHHLSKLVSAQLVSQNRAGRILYCVANFPLLDTVLHELKSQCCMGFGE